MTADKSFSFTQDQLCEIARDSLRYAREGGATSADVDVSEGWGHSVTVRHGEIETLEYNRDKGVSISVYVGKRSGHANSADFSAKALRDAVSAALTIARFTAEDPYSGLPETEELAREERDLELYHPWETDVEQSIALARRCEAAGLATSDAITNSEGASVSTQQSRFVTANSLDFCAGVTTSRHSLGCSLIAGRDDGMQRDDWWVSLRDASRLPSPESVGEIAAKRALARLGARRLPTCEAPVLFEPSLAAGLLGHFVQAASGGSLYRRASFLLDQLGKPVFSPAVTIREDPFIRSGLASSWFDDEGVATRAREVVTDGVLNGWFLGSYSARKLGLRTTGNAGGCHNLILAPGTEDFAALIRRMGRGLVVTELLGQGVNLVTGDYSRGAAGFWVEDGEIAYPVEEITIAGSLPDMFRDIVACGSDVEVRGSKQTGSILIASMKIAGQ